MSAQEQLLSGDPAPRIREFLHEEELAKLGITKDQAWNALKNIVAPEMRKVSTVSGRQPALRTGVRVTQSLDLRLSHRTEQLYIGVSDLPQGPRVFATGMAAYCLRSKILAGEADPSGAWKNECNAFVDRLEAAGLTGIYRIDSGELVPWPRF
ncbi:MAG TPA: hypothetical protein VEX38_08515 [Fimbriimonadaceae bacterium]|nr:hypothetical protein [Fimbriimonadaceae bacterium]